MDNDVDKMDINAYCLDKHFLLVLYTRQLAEANTDNKEGIISGQTP